MGTQTDFIDDGLPITGIVNTLAHLSELADTLRNACRPLTHIIPYYALFGSDANTVRRVVR